MDDLTTLVNKVETQIKSERAQSKSREDELQKEISDLKALNENQMDTIKALVGRIQSLKGLASSQKEVLNQLEALNPFLQRVNAYLQGIKELITNGTVEKCILAAENLEANGHTDQANAIADLLTTILS